MNATEHISDRQRGKLKIFMGYAAGVGKTYMMLEEAQELKALEVDVVVFRTARAQGNHREDRGARDDSPQEY
jgi:hypothetical protein